MTVSTARTEWDLSTSIGEQALRSHLQEKVDAYLVPAGERRRMIEGAEGLLGVLTLFDSLSLQARWESFEMNVWPKWVEGVERPLLCGALPAASPLHLLLLGGFPSRTHSAAQRRGQRDSKGPRNESEARTPGALTAESGCYE